MFLFIICASDQLMHIKRLTFLSIFFNPILGLKKKKKTFKNYAHNLNVLLRGEVCLLKCSLGVFFDLRFEKKTEK